MRTYSKRSKKLKCGNVVTLKYMANFFQDDDGVRGVWDGWCTSQCHRSIFGVIIVVIDDMWCRILLNTGKVIWVMYDELVCV